MRKFKTLILLFTSSVCLTGCSWGIDLLIANLSNNDVVIKYTLSPKNEYQDFFASPNTYAFSDRLSEIRKRQHNFTEIPTNYSFSNDSSSLRIIIKPGQAVHIGRYASFQKRDSIIAKHNLIIELESGTATNFLHWKNMYVDLLTIK